MPPRASRRRNGTLLPRSSPIACMKTASHADGPRRASAKVSARITTSAKRAAAIATRRRIPPCGRPLSGASKRPMQSPSPTYGARTSRPRPRPRPAPPGFIPSPDPRHDFRPPSLEWVQAALNRLHIPHIPLIVDGIEGKATRSAIVDFQEHAHLFIDGDAGKDTCAALEKVLGARDPPRGRSSCVKSQGQSK